MTASRINVATPGTWESYWIFAGKETLLYEVV